ncbi:MAG: hypothetical protein NC299_17315 [Lachnospiraceae bacterium]|nr:hypothetical protein [Lachnospiraceae bacterium]
MFNGTVTVYNTVEEDFKKRLIPRLLNGVHAEKTRGAEKAAEGDKNADDLLVMIPFSGHENLSLAVGDLIAIGDIGEADSFAELTTRAETFRITSVKTFDFGSLKHWEVIAK